MSNIFVSFAIDVEHGVEIAAEDLLKLAPKVESAAANAPQTVASLALVAGSIETAVNDAIAAGANPTSLVITLPTDLKDFVAVWTNIKAALATQGITV